MNPTPRLTVIVLIYNDARLGIRAIESVLNQSFTDFQLLVLDNGSTDDTAKLIAPFAQDPRVKIITNPVNQRSEFVVRVAQQIETEYVSILFSDDVYLPHRLETMIQTLDADAASAAVFSNNEFVDQQGRPVKRIPSTHFAGDVSAMSPEEHLAHMFLKGNSLHPCAMMIRTKDYLQLGGFKPFLHRLGDMAFFARLLSEKKVTYLKKPTQRLTLWSNGRNESSLANIDWNAFAYERLIFFEVFRDASFLPRLEESFPELKSSFERSANLNERLFWLAHRAFLVPAADYKLFAMKCFFDSYQASPEQIDAVCLKSYQMSFAQFCTWIQAGGLGEVRSRLRKLKDFVANTPDLRSIVRRLKPVIRLVGGSVGS